MAFRVFDPKHVRRQKFAKALVYLTKTACRHCEAFEMAIIDPALNGNVRLGFELEGAFFVVFGMSAYARPLCSTATRVPKTCAPEDNS